MLIESFKQKANTNHFDKNSTLRVDGDSKKYTIFRETKRIVVFQRKLY